MLPVLPGTPKRHINGPLEDSQWAFLASDLPRSHDSRRRNRMHNLSDGAQHSIIAFFLPRSLPVIGKPEPAPGGIARRPVTWQRVLPAGRGARPKSGRSLALARLGYSWRARHGCWRRSFPTHHHDRFAALAPSSFHAL